MYICIYMYIYRYVYIYVCVCVCVCARARVCVCVCRKCAPPLDIDVYKKARDRPGAHPGSSRPCAHCRAPDSPAAWPRSSLRPTRFDTARRRPAAPHRPCSCRRAHSTLHGTGWPRAHAPVPMQPAHGRRIGGVERNRAPSDAEDGVPVSAVTGASGALSSAFLAPTAPRRAWHLANSAPQLATCDASWGVIWARHTTPNVASTNRIAARLLQRAGDECAATIKPVDLRRSMQCAENPRMAGEGSNHGSGDGGA
jgi:hypothetical protein